MVSVYTDASSAILLQKTDLFDRLTHHTNVVFSYSVYQELTLSDHQDTAVFQSLVDHQKIKIDGNGFNTGLMEDYPRIQTLDKGEQETICLYLKNGNGFILTDDGKAARCCKEYGLPFINALLIPKLFWYAGIVSEETCHHQMEQLIRIGRYSQKVIRIAHNLHQKDLLPFLNAMNTEDI